MMNNNDAWLLPAIKEAVRDGDLALARSLAALGNTKKIPASRCLRPFDAARSVWRRFR